MRLLHTSDWHLGAGVEGRRRHEEFEGFFDWLLGVIEAEGVGALVVAGDVFDVGAPGNRAQELYYDFLRRAAASSCRHVVVVAGNHDSPTFLQAPAGLLRAFDIHVVGLAAERPEDEVLVLRDGKGRPELIVGAVPYLRDRDIRESVAGESGEEKDARLLDGLREHYRRVGEEAERVRRECGEWTPVVMTGHLFAAGGVTADGDGVRELHVGLMGRVPADVFPETADYVALGHLHLPQKVAGRENRRYSGAPLAMNFGEAGRGHGVCLVDLSPEGVLAREVAAPVFRRLELVRGEWSAIEKRLAALAEENGSEKNAIWLEIVYDGEDALPNLGDLVARAVAGTGLEAVRVKNTRIMSNVMALSDDVRTLEDLTENEVFERLLESERISEETREEYRRSYGEILLAMREKDAAAEY